MKNSELQKILAQYPGDMPIKIFVDHSRPKEPLEDFDEDHFMLSAETAYANSDAPEEEWDTEQGKFELGDGEPFLLINPMLV